MNLEILEVVPKSRMCLPNLLKKHKAGTARECQFLPWSQELSAEIARVLTLDLTGWAQISQDLHETPMLFGLRSCEICPKIL